MSFWTKRSAPVGGVVAACTIVLALGLTSYFGQAQQAEAAGWVEHTHLVIREFEQVSAGIAKAESAVRGFALSRDPQFIAEVEPALTRTVQAVREIKALMRANPAQQQQRVSRLERQVQRRVRMLHEHLQALQLGPAPVPRDAKNLTAEIFGLVQEMTEEERSFLVRRRADLAARTRNTLLSGAVALLFSVALLVGAFVLLNREIRARQRTHAEQQLMLDVAELLQACRTVTEAYEIIGQVGPRLFPGLSGALYVTHASRNLVEAFARWGDASDMVTTFEPDDCWALRRGQSYWRGPDTLGVTCSHCIQYGGQETACLPLLAHGEVIGVLHLRGSSPSELRVRATSIGEHVSLAIANLQLRESLRNQSIRDPLTGLFNRRYSEETFDRELARARREQSGLSVLMLDVDHFKSFNDRFGHEAGDQVLRALGSLLAQRTRGSDVASRMGGEEFVVLMPGAKLRDALAKAERLRAEVEKLELAHRGHPLGSITASFGVASFPEHGAEAEKLLRAADAALYRAKAEGRNRVVAAARLSMPQVETDALG